MPETNPLFAVGETVTLKALNWSGVSTLRREITGVVLNPHSGEWTYSGRGWVAPEATLLRDNPRGIEKATTVSAIA